MPEILVSGNIPTNLGITSGGALTGVGSINIPIVTIGLITLIGGGTGSVPGGSSGANSIPVLIG